MRDPIIVSGLYSETREIHIHMTQQLLEYEYV